METTETQARLSLPGYTRGEELFNMITHIVGGGLGVFGLLACAIVAAFSRNVWGIVSGCVYGVTVVFMFTMSSIYHGLRIEVPKLVFRIIDHCSIFILIAGTYTPVLLCSFRSAYPVDAWMIFALIWGIALIGVVLNTVSLERFKVFSLVCYLGMGWASLIRLPQLIDVLGTGFFVMMLMGGVVYTIGAVFYGFGRKRRYMHSVFHIFVDVASILHSVAIIVFVMPYS
jgi:hemolysin III